MRFFTYCYPHRGLGVILMFLLLFGVNSISSQTIYLDSLIQEALPKAKDDTSKVNLLNEISWRYHRIDYGQTIEYGKTALGLADSLSYDKGRARAMNLMAIGYDFKGDWAESVRLNETCYKIGEETNNSYLMNIAANDLGISYGVKGDYETSMEYYQIALDLSLKSNDMEGAAYGYMNMGWTHFNLGNIEEAVEKLEESVRCSEKLNDPILLTMVYENKAEIYFETEKLDSAKIYLDLAYGLAEENKDLITMTSVKTSLAYYFLEKGYKELAEKNAYQVVELAKETKDPHRETYSYITLADIQLGSGEVEKAKNNAILAKELMIENDFIEPRVNIYYLLYQIYEEEGNFEKSLRFHEYYHDLQDSLVSIEKIKNISELNKKYQLDRKIEENENLLIQQKKDEALLKEQRLFNFSLFIISLLLGVVGLLMYRFYRLKDSSHKLLEKKIEERTKELLVVNNDLKNSNIELERFAYIASHDLKEPLRNIGSFAKLLNKSSSGKFNARENEYMSFISKNAFRMEQLIEDVLEYSKISKNENVQEKIALEDVVKDIEYSLENTLKKKNSKIILKHPLPEIIGHPFRIHLLFKNLIENGIKYNESECPTVTISYESNLNEHIYIVSDNGIGIEEEYFSMIFEMFKRLHNRETYEGTGLGLALSQKIVTDLGGRVKLESEVGKGSTFYIFLPKER